MNFQYNVNSNIRIGKRHHGHNKLSPATEYWLNRVLRDHAHQIFIVAFLFLAIIFASVVYAILNPSVSDTNGSSINIINATIPGSTTNKVIINNDGVRVQHGNDDIFVSSEANTWSVATSSSHTVTFD